MAMPRVSTDDARSASRVLRQQFGDDPALEMEMHVALGLVPYEGFDTTSGSGGHRGKVTPAYRMTEFFDAEEEREKDRYRGRAYVNGAQPAFHTGFNNGLNGASRRSA